MIPDDRHTIYVGEWGPVNDAELSNAIGVANQLQDLYNFILLENPIPLPKDRAYRCRNGGYDLDKAARHVLRTTKLPRPLMLVTRVPYTDQQHKTEADYFYFGEISLSGNPDTAVVSTYVWDTFLPKRHLEPYILLMLATFALDRAGTVQFHPDTRGCVLDYCNEVADIDRVLENPGFCSNCEIDLEKKVRNGTISHGEISAIRRILFRAAGKKLAFVIMPFKKQYWSRYHGVIIPALLRAGYTPKTANDYAKQRDILDAIIKGIREADLVIADVSENNPNVFWEYGVAYALGRDYVILSKKRKLPFDIARSRCIFYRSNATARLERELVKFL